MGMDFFEAIKILSSIVTPVVVLVVAYKFNRTLAKMKNSDDRISEWSTSWAEQLLEAGKEINSAATNVVVGLYAITNDDSNDEEYERIRKSLQRLRWFGWNIKNFTQFVPHAGPDVEETMKDVTDELEGLLKKRKGDLEAVRACLFRFNSAIRDAHAELLNIDSLQS